MSEIRIPKRSPLEGLMHVQAAMLGMGLVYEEPRAVDDGSTVIPAEDGALLAPEGTVCFACNREIRPGWPTRVSRRGPRHDTCP